VSAERSSIETRKLFDQSNADAMVISETRGQIRSEKFAVSVRRQRSR
jgi:hypothetical protein